MSIEIENPPAGTGHSGAWRARGTALTAALLAGMAAWAVVEASGVHRFVLPAHLIGKIGPGSDDQALMKAAAEDRGATTAFTALGLALGLALAGAGRLARGSPASGPKAAALGVAAGAGAGFVASQAVLPFFHRYQLQLTDGLLLPMVLHGVIWGAVGAGAGLAYGLGLGRRGTGGLARPVVGGLVGALLGELAFELFGALTLPASGTAQPLPTNPNARLLATLALSLSAAAGAAWDCRPLAGTEPGLGAEPEPEPA
jgi:hypothetical protein